MSRDEKEKLRLIALNRLRILDTEAEPEFDQIVELASQISGCPISLISLVDENRQWFKARVGLDVRQTARNISFCHHAIQGDEAYVVSNAKTDARFKNNPLVQGFPNISFYLGHPLITQDGFRIGTLCTIDRVPRELTQSQIEQLKNLSKLVVRVMEMRLANQRSQKFEDFLSNVTSPAIMMNGPNHEVVYTNKPYNDIFLKGQSPIGKKISELLPDAEEQGFIKTLDYVYKTGKLSTATEVLYKRNFDDGTVQDFYLDITYSAKRNSEDIIEGVFALIVDVTDKVQARRKVENEEAYLTQMLNVMPQMSFLADAQGNIIEFNQRWYEFAGHPGEFKDWEWTGGQVHHPDDLKRTIETWAQSIRTGNPYEIEYRLRRKDGVYRWHLGRAQPIRDDAGKIIRWFGTNTDIHEQKTAAEKLAASERLLALTADAVPALIAYIDTDLTYRFVNSAYTKWFNLPISYFIGKPIVDIVGENVFNAVKPRFERALKGEQVSFEQEAHYPHGTRMIQVSYSPEIDCETGKVRGIVTLVQDITDKKNIEQVLKDSKVAADVANEAKSTFLANMSHEIRTPLGTIMGFSELAKQAPGISKEITDFLDVIHRNSVQTLKIVDDILDLAKVESGRITVENLNIKLTTFLGDFASLIKFRAHERGIDFKIIADTDLPETVEIDPTRVRQVLTNVVGNAIKFTAQGTVALHAAYRNGFLEFGVKDSGRGISPEQAKQLFQPFVQADISTTRQYGGTGLGLVLTKRLCQAMGGDFVLMESALNKGSYFLATIAVTLPNTEFVPQAQIVFKSETTKTSPSVKDGRLKGIKVLLVEDSLDNQELLKLVLERQGAEFTLATNGVEAVEAALTGHADIVLMDVQMPIMDGYEAVRHLRAKGYSKPIIALTAHAMREEYERAIKVGCSDYLSKPVSQNDLISKILNTTAAKN